MGFSCSACFLLLPVLLFLYAAENLEAPALLWVIPALLSAPGLAYSIRASRLREHLGDGLDVLTSLGVGLGWTGVAAAPFVLVFSLLSLVIGPI